MASPVVDQRTSADVSKTLRLAASPDPRIAAVWRKDLVSCSSPAGCDLDQSADGDDVALGTIWHLASLPLKTRRSAMRAEPRAKVAMAESCRLLQAFVLRRHFGGEPVSTLPDKALESPLTPQPIIHKVEGSFHRVTILGATGIEEVRRALGRPERSAHSGWPWRARTTGPRSPAAQGGHTGC
jgi:hypothetical protein